MRRWWLVVLLSCEVCCIYDGSFNLNGDAEFTAIKTIHKQLDDNADGSVDFSESQEFVKTELCGGGGGKSVPTMDEADMAVVCMESEKSLKFHQEDTEITSTEFWVNWHQNQVFNWTNADVLNWLECTVELPQYVDVFKSHQITGRQLPFIAINAGQVLQITLLITDSQHKQKIQLRAMDVVLFGPSVSPSYWKDATLVICVVLCLGGLVYTLRQRRLAKCHMDSFMTDLKLKEEEVQQLKSKFEKLELDHPREEVDIGGEDESMQPIMMNPIATSLYRQSSEEDDLSMNKTCSQDPDSSLYQTQARLELLQQRVWCLEMELEEKGSALQVLEEILPECKKKEREHLEFRKSLGEEQIAKAQRACDKIRKRQSSIFGTLHLVNSSALEEAGLHITRAVNKMQSISESFEEYHKRWSKIGQITGLPYSPREKMQNSPENLFPLPQRMFKKRASDTGLFSYNTSLSSPPTNVMPYHMIGSGGQNGMNGGSRGSIHLESLTHSQLISLREQSMDFHMQSSLLDRQTSHDSLIQSRTASLYRSSRGAHKHATSLDECMESSSSSQKDPVDGDLSEVNAEEQKSKEKRKQKSPPQCPSPEEAHPQTTGSRVRSRARQTISSDV